MVLPIVKYGTPVLRKKGSRIEKLTPSITDLISDMIETMMAAHGVGLAAQQVGQPLQLAIVDVRGIADRPSSLELDGKLAEVDFFMPVVLINPELTPTGERAVAAEGCLSFPEIYADISRPESVSVKAQNAKGEKITFRCGGLLARAVQHEVDHLNGILFIDRMETLKRRDLKAELDELHAETKAALQRER